MMRKLLSRLFPSRADRQRADRLRALEMALQTATEGERPFSVLCRAHSYLTFWITGEING